MVKKPMLSGLLLLAACALFPVAALAGHGKEHGHGISTSSHGALTTCDDWEVTFDGERAIVTSETMEIAGSTLAVEAAKNGGATIRGGSGRGFSVTLCRAASPSLGAGAASQIRLSRSGSTLTVDGPSADDWAAHLIITTPRGANLRASATNGPVDVSEFDGTLDVATTNGPLSLEKSSGTISGKTTNGPLSFDEGSGEVSLRATNGPLTVRLTGTAWLGQSFDASTVNGPLSIALPRGFSSGVEIRSDGHTPWRCPEALCGATTKSWHEDDDEKVVRFGGASPVVRIATENGPVSVKER